MIRGSDLVLIGKVNKTHGVGGELSISFFSPPVKDSIEPGSCLIFDMEGIFTPFFVESERPRSSEALLIKIQGLDSQEQAQGFVGRSAFMLNEAVPAETDENDEEGLYAGQLVGYKACQTTGALIGEIEDIDEATENVLFVVRTPQGSTAYIPVADEFINDISINQKTITFDLPEGLLSL